jgi:starch-binding outer membrane protein, SusD/RagB family
MVSNFKNLMKMKNLKYLLYLLLPLSVLTSCNDLLDVKTKSLADSNDNTLSSPNDSVYSIFGILSQFQKLGDSYVVLGELRGDLLDVTDSASNDLREINSFNISATNSYVGVAKFYAVINNCNYVIAHMDTTIGNKALLPDYTAAVAIRAWTYFQLATNYRDVRYSDTPIESVQQAKDLANFPVKTRDEIFDLLIPQLQRIQNQPLSLYSVNGIPVSGLVPDPKTILADIYLWKGGESDLINAATYYKKMFESDSHYTTYSSIITYGLNTATVHDSWSTIFSSTTSKLGSDVESIMYYQPESGNQSQLQNLFVKKYMIKPSSLSIDIWISQNIKTSIPALLVYGDRRGCNNAWVPAIKSSSKAPVPVVYKYSRNSGSIILSRSAKYLLRYAEAVNRLGKPTLALAVVNYGLTQNYINDAAFVKPAELSGKPYYLNFDNKIYYWGNTSIYLSPMSGIRNRVGLNPVKFPTNLTTLSDSILFVENTIVNEAGLETAFEGNRWTDLVRVALRRLPSATADVKLQDPNFLGNMVARKFDANPKSYIPFVPTYNAADIRSRLNADQSLWFLPFK